MGDQENESENQVLLRKKRKDDNLVRILHYKQRNKEAQTKRTRFQMKILGK